MAHVREEGRAGDWQRGSLMNWNCVGVAIADACGKCALGMDRS